MMDQFESILEDLGKDFSISLKPDTLNSCTLKIDKKLLVQIKIDKTNTFLLIATEIEEIPPGKFRENIFTFTLLANNKIPRVGNFGFNDKNSKLILFEYIPLDTLKKENLKNTLASFIEKAFLWKNAIETNISKDVL